MALTALGLVLLGATGLRVIRAHNPEDAQALELPLSISDEHPAISADRLVDTVTTRRWIAKVVPAKRVSLQAPEDADLTRVNVNVGQAVRRGDILFTLEDPALLVEAQATARKLARLRFNLQADSPEMLRAQAAARRAQLELARVQADVDIHQTLFDKGLIPENELRKLIDQRQDAQTQLAAATQEFEMTHSLLSVSRDDWTSELAAQAVLGERNAQRMASLTIRAPFDGVATWVIGANAATPRKAVKKGADLVSLDSADAIAVELTFLRSAETDRLFAVGTSVELSLSDNLAPRRPTRTAAESAAATQSLDDPAPGPLRGQVSALATPSDAERFSAATSRVASIAIDPGQWARMPASSRESWVPDASVDVLVAKRTKSLAIPIAAVTSRQDRHFVYVRGLDRSWQRREVFGSADEHDQFLVEAGLVRGEAVARLK